MEQEKPTQSQLLLIKCICQYLHIEPVQVKTRAEDKRWLKAHEYEEERVRNIAFC